MNFSSSFSFTNAALFGGFLSRIVPGVNDAVDKAGEEIIALCDTEVKSRLYPGHGFMTGNLRESYHGVYTKSGSSIGNIEYGTDVEYGPYVEFRWGGIYAHFFPAMMVVEPQIPIILKKHIDGALGI